MNSKGRRSTSFMENRPSSSKKSRASMSSFDFGRSDRTPNQTLIETLMNDPVKRALVMQLLSQDKTVDLSSQRNKVKTPVAKVKKRVHCESPTALWRRKALEQRNQTDRSSESEASESVTPSPLPFESLLEGVVAYVEVRGRDGDRSSGAQALMRAMGATVMDTFTKGVTHVIFKDGTFTTYQKAKLMRIPMVSILWLEAVRTNRYRVPEKNYPALGIEAYDQNVSTICDNMHKEYEEVVRDEYRRSLSILHPGKSKASNFRKTALPNELKKATGRSISPSSSGSDESDSEDVIAPTQDFEVMSILSNATSRKDQPSRRDWSPPDSLDLPDSTADTSDTNSESVCVNGYSSKKIKNSIDVAKELFARRSTKLPLPPDEHGDSDIECNNSESVLTTSIIKSRISKNSTIYPIDNMEMTNIHLSANKENRMVCEGNDVSDVNNTNTSVLREYNGSIVHSTNKNLICETVDTSKSTSTRRKSVLCQSKNSSTQELSALRISAGSDSAKEKLSMTQDMSPLQISENSEYNRLKNSIVSEDMSILRVSESLSSKRNSGNNKTSLSSQENMSSLALSFQKRDRLSSQTTENVSKSLEKTNSLTNETNDPRPNLVNSIRDTRSKEQCSAEKKRKRDELESIPKKTKNNMPNRRLSVRIRNLQKSNNDTQDSNSKTAYDKLNTPVGLPNEVIKNKIENSDGILHKRISDEIATPGIDTNKQGSTSIPKRDRVETESQQETLHKKIENFNKESEPQTHMRRTACRNKINSETESSNSSKTEENRSTLDSEVDSKIRKKTVKDQPVNAYLNLLCKVQGNKSKEIEGIVVKRKVRKLFNLRDCVDDSIFKNVDWAAQERAERLKLQTGSNTEIVFKKPIPPLTPVLLTKSAVKRLENQRTINSTRCSSSYKDSKRNKPNKQEDNIKKNTPSFTQNDKFVFKAPKKIEKITTSRKEQVSTDSKEATVTRSRRSSSARKSALSETSDSDVPIIPLYRRSTLDFVPADKASKPLKAKSPKKTSIACTRLHRPQVEEFQNIVKKLGVFFVEDEVTCKTSHLVVGENKRTINLLRAIARGCWIVKHEWLYKSLEAGKWLPEEDYEMSEFSPAVTQCRIQKHAFGSKYTMDIFQDCGPIYIARSSTPRCSDLQELVKLCKGTLTSVIRNAAIAVGESVRNDDAICVSEQWILDSIKENSRKPYDDYLIRQPNSPTF